MDKKLKIKKLNQKIKNCKKCPLWKTRNNTVPGEGPINAKIMIIGQAPGFQEDKTGRPFVGRAGQFLNQLLKIAKIKREKIFITSPLKCFPPKNRKPKKEEIKSCLPYLKKQIEIINPSQIVILGEVAFDTVIGLGKLKDSRGRWLKIKERFYFPTYHPAAGLRFPKIKKILEKDFRTLNKVY
jgi:DNA polymerase